MRTYRKKGLLRVVSTFSLILGLIILEAAFRSVFRNTELLLDPLFYWRRILYFPRELYFIIAYPELMKNAFFHSVHSLYFVINIAILVLSWKLPRLLHRDPDAWFIFTIIFPYLIIVLAIRGLLWNIDYFRLDEKNQYDLYLLYEKGFVRPKASGQTITNIYGNIENLIDKSLNVIVKPGTFFVSSGNHQNMATTTKYSFYLKPYSTEQFEIRAVCINAAQPIPNEKDQFVGVAYVPDDVAIFIEASQNEDPMVIQAGVWTLTDNLNRHQIINHLTSRDKDGNTWHPIKQVHCDIAASILNHHGIPHLL